MEYQLQLKPFAGRKDGFRYEILEITDFTLHTNKLRSTENVGQKIEEAIQSHAPGRIYMSNQNGLKNGVVDFSALNRNPDLIRYIREKEKQGVKVLLRFPGRTAPIVLCKDTVEFIESTKGQRVLRWLKRKTQAIVNLNA